MPGDKSKERIQDWDARNEKAIGHGRTETIAKVSFIAFWRFCNRLE